MSLQVGHSVHLSVGRSLFSMRIFMLEGCVKADDHGTTHIMIS